MIWMRTTNVSWITVIMQVPNQKLTSKTYKTKKHKQNTQNGQFCNQTFKRS